MEEAQTPQRPKLDGKDRLIGQLENQRNGALTQSAIFGAERDAFAEQLQETEQALAMQKLHNQVLQKRVDEMSKPPEPPPADEATVATPAASDAPAADAPVDQPTGTEG